MRAISTTFLLCAALAAPTLAQGGGAGWMHSDWGKRLPLRLASPPDSLMTGVVLVVDGNSAAALLGGAKPDGSDLRVTGADGITALPFHLVEFAPGSSALQLWIRGDEVGPSATRFYVYFDNPAASSASNAPSTWADFDAVFLYEAVPGGPLPDSSGNGNNAAQVAGPWNAGHRVTGKIGRAWTYAGGRSVGVWGKQITEGAEWTVSAWARATGRGTDFLLQGNPCFFSLHIQASNISWDTGQYKNDYCPSVGWSIRTNRLLDINSWHHHSWSTDAADSLITYSYDGQRIAYNTQTDRNFPNVAEIPNIKWRAHPVGSTSEGVGIGSVMYPNNQDDMDGDVDQFTIRSFKLPAKLLAVEYANQNSPAAFWIAETVEDRPGTPAARSSMGAIKALFGGN